MIDGPHHIITYSETDESEPRRLLTEDELRFSLRMSLRDCRAFGGLPRHNQDSRKAMIEEAVAAHIKLCGYQVFGKIAQPRPVSIGPRKHIWKTDEELERDAGVKDR